VSESLSLSIYLRVEFVAGYCKHGNRLTCKKALCVLVYIMSLSENVCAKHICQFEWLLNFFNPSSVVLQFLIVYYSVF
jgi:hypothetical protein